MMNFIFSNHKQNPYNSLPMDNYTSPDTRDNLQDWCDSQAAHHGHLPAIIWPSFIINAAINSIIACAAVIGNTLILLALKKASRVQAASKALYCSLAVSDLAVGLFVQPLFVVHLVAGREGNTDMCKLMAIIINVTGVISVGVSLQTLTAISVDRVLAIRLKMRYKKVVTVTRKRIVLAICWCFSTFHAAVIFVSPTFFNLFQILGIIMCIGVSTVSYIIIFRNLRHLQNQVHNYSPGEEATRKASFNIKLYKKTVSTALWVYGSLLVCYLPFMLTMALRMSIEGNATFIGVSWFSVSLLYMNSALNPILYCWKIQEVRESMKEVARQCCPCFLGESGNTVEVIVGALPIEVIKSDASEE